MGGTVKLIDGPMDGQWIEFDGEHLIVEGNPSVPIFPLGGDNKIVCQRGRYSRREWLTNSLQWDGWYEL